MADNHVFENPWFINKKSLSYIFKKRCSFQGQLKRQISNILVEIVILGFFCSDIIIPYFVFYLSLMDKETIIPLSVLLLDKC